MGKLEKEVKREIRITKIQKAILHAVGAAGLLSIALLAPNVLKILPKFSNSLKRSRQQSINTSRRRLVDNGILKYDKNGFLLLTEKGEEKLRRIRLLE